MDRPPTNDYDKRPRPRRKRPLSVAHCRGRNDNGFILECSGLMKTFVALLRAVTPTGKNKVPMAPLREALSEAGLVDVRTYIQSGNVLARSDLPATDVEALVHDTIEQQFGGDLIVVVRTPAQMRNVLQGNPFEPSEAARTHFTFLSKKPGKRAVNDLVGQSFPPDRFVVTSQVVYLNCPQGYGVSKLSNNFLERKLGVSATTRNHNTVTKLVELTTAFRI
jgi:uncharacterized protein (DUF1697 family)